MQIQRLNMQSPAVQNKQNKAKGQPAFGIKFYMEKQLADNVLSAVDDYVDLVKDVKKPNVVNVLLDETKKFFVNLPRFIAEHNANPENHKFFNNGVEIEKVAIGYDHPEQGFLSIVDSSGVKLPTESNGQQILNNFENFSRKNKYYSGTLLKARIQTNTGVEINAGSLSEFKDAESYRKMLNSLQQHEVIKSEVKTPDCYWDMIKPPSDTTVITVRQSNKH